MKPQVVSTTLIKAYCMTGFVCNLDFSHCVITCYFENIAHLINKIKQMNFPKQTKTNQESRSSPAQNVNMTQMFTSVTFQIGSAERNVQSGLTKLLQPIIMLRIGF